MAPSALAIDAATLWVYCRVPRLLLQLSMYYPDSDGLKHLHTLRTSCSTRQRCINAACSCCRSAAVTASVPQTHPLACRPPPQQRSCDQNYA
jgi:hypothetical protein